MRFILVLLSSWQISLAWLQPKSLSVLFSNSKIDRTFSSSSSLWYFKENKDDKNNDEEEEIRMKAVRSLQLAFYQQDSESSSSEKKMAMTRLEAVTGKLSNLPLWRAPWWEVPGRSNVLNVHDPIYTNMFEQIIRSEKPWIFGHLYLQGGSQNLKENNLDTLDTYNSKKDSAIIGCVLNIQDYRRFSNGRLLLLVHVMERFVVTNIHQELPYSIVDAQILPDAEEMDPSLTTSDMLHFEESEMGLARGLAVQESLRFHDYEYDPEHSLSGVTNKTYLEPTDILWSAIARVLPYCPFSKTIQAPLPTEGTFFISKSTSTSTDLPGATKEKQEKEETSLEYKLLEKGILQVPLFDPDFDSKYQHLTTDELEHKLWMTLNHYLKETKTPVSPILLGLLPPAPMVNGTEVTANSNLVEQEWPKEFTLYPIVQELQQYQNYTHDFVRVSSAYPAHRRQRRLSYSALHLLEKTADKANKLRPQLLKTPSTRERLRLVLEKFDEWQESKWGEFL